MLKNYFNIAFRNLRRNKVFSLINIAGLAIGMASAILIGLWIMDELNFDRFHQKESRIYLAYRFDSRDAITGTNNYTPKILGPTLKASFPEIEEVARWTGTNFLFTVGDRHFNVAGSFTDSGFLRMFSFPMLEGNPLTALKNPSDIVITQSLATRLFGKEPAFGKQIRIDSVDLFTVKGILKDLPDNTQFRFEFLLPWSYQKKIGWDDDYWENNSCRTYYLLRPGITGHDFDARFRNTIIKHTAQQKIPSTDILFGHPAADWHLYSRFDNGRAAGGAIEIVRMFIITAIFILLIACINFMNLSTARSEKRVKEVGIRKVVGAPRSFLIWQFLAESLLFSLIAGILALIIVEYSLDSFNQLVNKRLFIDFSNIRFWMTALGFILFTGLLAGSYPAFYLSSFQPIKVLKGVFRAGRQGAVPRKFLVVLQFSFAIMLIISTVVVMRQLQYGQERESGYKRDNLIYNYMQGDIPKNYPMIRDELLSKGVALSVSRTSGPMTRHWADSWGFEWPGSTEEDKKTDFNFFSSDAHFVQTMGLKLVAGRDMDPATWLTDSTAVMLNESAVKIMRLKDPVGQIVKLNGDSWHVVGVIKDFILESPYSPVAPMIISGPKGMNYYIINMKLNPARTVSDNLKIAESIFKKYNPSYPFEYNFVDQEYAEKFANERRTGRLAALFAGLTIFISCLGLFGLANFMAENRVKEIGIRKVLGASVLSITQLLSKDFLRLVMISFLIASPLAWWAMSGWLRSYTYRIEISWWIFVLVFLISVAIALVTVSFQSIKAAMMNPATSLRSE